MMALSKPAAELVAVGGDSRWLLAALLASGLVLLAYGISRHRVVRRLHITLETMFDPHVLGLPVRDESGRIVDFTYTDANPAACTWMGRERDQIIGRRMLDVYPAIATTGLLKAFADTANTGRSAVIDGFAFPLNAADVRWLDIRAVRVDECVGFTWRDVTERHDVAAKLAASEQLFRLLAENSSDVVVRADTDGRVMWVSPSIRSVLGWSPDDWIGRKGEEFQGSSEGRERFQGEWRKALAGQSIVIRTQMLAKEGDVHWVEIHAGPSRTAEGRIDGIVASFRIVDREIEAERTLDRRARTDELTKLLNRKEVLERIDSLSKRGGSKIAVLWCDIDRFKSVNDLYGHAAGDAVLQSLAERIRASLRTTDDLAARIGGDELMVILHGVHDLQDALDVAEKLRGRAAEPIATAAGPISTTLSIGVTLAHPYESTDALIARADDAMYQAKKCGRNQVVAIAEARTESASLGT